MHSNKQDIFKLWIPKNPFCQTNVGKSSGKTFQRPNPVQVKPRKDINSVSCRRDMTEITVESGVKHHSINQLSNDRPNNDDEYFLDMQEIQNSEKFLLMSACADCADRH